MATDWDRRFPSIAINSCGLPGGAVPAIDGEWHLELPDGTGVLVQRDGEQWIVHCRHAHVLARNLDVALAEAIYAATGVAGHMHDGLSASWIRGKADEIAKTARQSTAAARREPERPLPGRRK
jgi:hypothetical protein